MNIGDKVYRYEDTLYSSGDYEYSKVYVKVELREYDILKITPTGIRVGYSIFGDHPGRFVNLKAHKKYVCLTKEEALKSFIIRKEKQIRILTSKILYIKDALAQVT